MTSFTNYAYTELFLCQLGDSSWRKVGICGPQTDLQTTWALMVKSHRLTYGTAWAQPWSQSIVLVSEEPVPYHDYNLLVIFSWTGKPLQVPGTCSQWHLMTLFMVDWVLRQGWNFPCDFLEGSKRVQMLLSASSDQQKTPMKTSCFTSLRGKESLGSGRGLRSAAQIVSSVR